MIFDQFLDPSYTLPRKDQPEQIVWNGVNYYVLTIFFDTIALCVRREDADGGAAYINTCIVPYIKGLTSFLEQQQPPAADATVAEEPVAEAPADAPAADSPPA